MSTIQDIKDADLKMFKKIKSAIDRGLDERKVLKLSYKDSKDKVTVRDVEPLEIKPDGSLFAWCLLRNSVRKFKMPQIVDIAVTEKPFEVRRFDKEGEIEERFNV